MAGKVTHADVLIVSMVTTEPEGLTGPRVEQSTEDLVTVLDNYALAISYPG
jgi:hypothetical protein